MKIVIGSIFREYLARFRGLSPKSRPFLIYQPITINQEPVMLRFWFLAILKMSTEIIKTKHQLKITRSCCIAILSKSARN